MAKIAPKKAGIELHEIWKRLGEIDEKLDRSKLGDQVMRVEDLLSEAQCAIDSVVCILVPEGIES